MCAQMEIKRGEKNTAAEPKWTTPGNKNPVIKINQQ